MFDKLANIFRIPDLRKRILFTLAMLFVYRLGGHLSTPQKEGELGRKKITQWTRYITVILSSVQSFGIAVGLEKGGFALNPGWGFRLMTMLTLTTGSAFIMWLGEQITERGVGNGMSLLIFAGIVVGLPRGVVDL